MLFPGDPPILNKPAVAPTAIPMKPEVVVVPPWLRRLVKPDTLLFCMLVATVVLVVGAFLR